MYRNTECLEDVEGEALTVSGLPYKLVSWLSSLTSLWPTSLVVCYAVGLLRLAKQRKTS